MGPDPDKTVVMALRVWGYKQGEVVSLMIHLGDRLGIYRALDGAGLGMQSIQLARPSLDDVFLTVTGRSLRDDSPAPVPAAR